MAKKEFKIVGITVSISFVMFIALAFFIKALDSLYSDWFTTNAKIIAVVSGVIVLLGLVTGTIAIKTLGSKSKSFIS